MRALILGSFLLLAGCKTMGGPGSKCQQEISDCLKTCPGMESSSPASQSDIGADQRSNCERRCHTKCN